MVSYLKEDCVNLIEIDVGTMPPIKLRQYLKEYTEGLRKQPNDLLARFSDVYKEFIEEIKLKIED